jgi:membrane protein
MKGLKGILPQDGFLILETTIRNIISIQSGGLVSINFFLALFMASNAVNSMMKAFDKINEYEQKRTFWEKRFAAFRLMLLITLQIIIALLLIIKGKQILLFITQIIATKSTATYILLRISKDLLILFSFYNIINLIYYYGLSDKRNFKYFSVGTSFATLFSISISIIFQVYTSFLNNFNRLYGSLGIMIVIMMLIYLNAMVLLFGFELNNSITLNKQLKEKEAAADGDANPQNGDA